MKVLLIEGGSSSEREISLATGNAVGEALRVKGHEVVRLDPAPDGRNGEVVGRLAGAVLEHRPDLAFIALHGGDGEDGHVQAVLDLLGLPYTGSGTLASALAMDKAVAKAIFVQNRVPTPPWRVLTSNDAAAARAAVAELSCSVVVVKPVNGGSTVGTTIVEDVNDTATLRRALDAALKWDEAALIEAYIPGREITVGVLDRAALPVVEIVPESGFYDYEHKYSAGRSRYVVPAELSQNLASEVSWLGETAYTALGCRGGARVDFRLSPEGEFFCLEVNTIPGMTATSLLPMAARAAGMDFPALIERLCRSAHSRGR